MAKVPVQEELSTTHDVSSAILKVETDSEANSFIDETEDDVFECSNSCKTTVISQPAPPLDPLADTYRVIQVYAQWKNQLFFTVSTFLLENPSTQC